MEILIVVNYRVLSQVLIVQSAFYEDVDIETKSGILFYPLFRLLARRNPVLVVILMLCLGLLRFLLYLSSFFGILVWCR